MSKQTRQKSSKTGAPRAAAAKSPTRTKSPSKSESAARSASGQAAQAGRKAAPSRSESSHPAAATTLKAPVGKSAKVAAAAVGGLVEGSKAPAFSLPRDGGSTVTLNSFAGRKLVIFFYPRAGTPGCTREAIDFSRLAPQFDKAGVSLLGVSADPPTAQEKFRDKHQLTMPLASDEPHAMLQAYAAWGEKTLYGKKFEGILRTTVLIGADGRIERVWRNVKVDGHAEAVLAAAVER